MDTNLNGRIENLKRYRDRYVKIRGEQAARLNGIREDGASGMFPLDKPSRYIDLRTGNVLSLDERIDRAAYVLGRISALDNWISEIEQTIELLERFVREDQPETETENNAEKSSSPGFSRSPKSPNQLLLVEGTHDVEYFELLRDPAHGENQLRIDGIITPYGGKDGLVHEALVKAVLQVVPRVFITYDLDAEKRIKPKLEEMGLKYGADFCEVGLQEKGKDCIEGLVPDEIYAEVLARNVNLARRLAADSSERNVARQELKRKLLDEFGAKIKPGHSTYSQFYSVVAKINKGLNG